MNNAKSFLWVLLVTFLITSPVSAQQFGPWSAPVNLGPPVNTILPEYQPFITRDGLSLYFSLLEGVGVPQTTPQDMWVAKRVSENDPWGTPERLGPTINIAGPGKTEGMPFVTFDGHRMYFQSNRKTPDRNGVVPFGRGDIYVSRRHNNRYETGPLGWQEPENVGGNVNTAASEGAPWLFEDEKTGTVSLYFQSDRNGSTDLFVCTLQPDGTWGTGVPIPELVPGTVNTGAADSAPMITRDGLELYFISDRPGSTPYPPDDEFCGIPGQPSPDIWVSTRASTSDPWGPAQNLDAANAALGGPAINSAYHDGRPVLSFDGDTIYFFSACREGNQSPYFDIWKSTRTKLTGGAHR
jgi:hypothetical protein